MLKKERPLRYFILRNVRILFLILVWAFISTSVAMFINGEGYSFAAIASHIMVLELGYCNYLWFMCVLFMINCISPVVHPFVAINKNNALYLLGLLFWWILLRQFTWKLTLLNSWWGTFGFLYYILGYVLLTYPLGISKTKLALLSIICCLLHSTFNYIATETSYVHSLPKPSLLFDLSVDAYGYWTIFIFIGVATTLSLISSIEISMPTYLRFAANNTLGIYLLQGPIYRSVLCVYPNVKSLGLLFPLGVIVISCSFVYCIKKIPIVKNILIL